MPLLLFRATNVGHVFGPGVVSPATLAQVRSAVTAKQVTDHRYLWGLARHYRGLLVTFDRGLSAAGRDDVCLLLPRS
jgi:hypothetical protein